MARSMLELGPMRAIAHGVVIVILFACNGTSNREDLTEEVLSCEEAVSKLADCCPGFHASWIECVDREFENEETGCGTAYQSGHTRPALNRRESGCIRSTSCSDLVGMGICARAQAAEHRGVVERHEGSPTGPSQVSTYDHPEVCP